MNPAQLGRWGEQAALEHYLQEGYRLLAANFRTRFGELDVVVEKEGVVVIAEVKTRGPGAIASPAAWVDAKKQLRIIRAAGEYLQLFLPDEPAVRFDVVEVTPAKDGGAAIHRIENAFSV